MESQLTTLGRAKVFAWGGSPGTTTASLFDAQSATFNDFTLEAFLGSIGLLGSHHLDEAKATRLLGVRIGHDGAVLDIAVLFEEAADVGFGQTRMDTGDEEVGPRVEGTLLVVQLLAGIDRATGVTVLVERERTGEAIL